MRIISWLFFLNVFFSYSAFAKDLIGVASVIDGDTLYIQTQRIRLYGVDAPESSQLCEHQNGKYYRCGQQSALKLHDLIGRQTVRCLPKDKDHYGRIVAVCYVGKTNINYWLVRNGLAMAYQQYSLDYIKASQVARVEKIGIWQGFFEAPWNWRHAQKKHSKTNR